MPSLRCPDALIQWGLDSLLDDSRLVAITEFAANLCDTSTALVSIVGSDSQDFLARKGFDGPVPPVEHSFCAHAMLGTMLMVIPDASVDPHFADNPLVTAKGGIRFYAGAPLQMPDGAPFGSLCVIDSKPRDGLTPLQEQGLLTLAQSVMALIGARQAEQEHHRNFGMVSGERDEQTQLFRVLADSMPQMVWSTRPDGFHDYYNARWYDFTGMTPGSTDGEGWRGMFHIDDQPIAGRRWKHSLATGDPYEIEYRLRAADGSYRWVLGRAMPLRAADGAITRWFGTCTDIHDQKLLMEQREILAQELSHRIKNIFAVIGGLISMSIREKPEYKAIAVDLRDRVMALGRAHDYVRPHSEASVTGSGVSDLHGILADLLAPYRSGNPDDDRIVISGDNPRVDDRSATPLALLFHELATNASKYGSLSVPGGRLALTIAVNGDQVVVDWIESGVNNVAAPSHEGFGSRLIALSIERQLGGTIERLWEPDGLNVRVTLALSNLHRPANVGRV